MKDYKLNNYGPTELDITRKVASAIEECIHIETEKHKDTEWGRCGGGHIHRAYGGGQHWLS